MILAVSNALTLVLATYLVKIQVRADITIKTIKDVVKVTVVGGFIGLLPGSLFATLLVTLHRGLDFPAMGGVDSSR